MAVVGDGGGCSGVEGCSLSQLVAFNGTTCAHWFDKFNSEGREFSGNDTGNVDFAETKHQSYYSTAEVGLCENTAKLTQSYKTQLQLSQTTVILDNIYSLLPALIGSVPMCSCVLLNHCEHDNTSLHLDVR